MMKILNRNEASATAMGVPFCSSHPVFLKIIIYNSVYSYFASFVFCVAWRNLFVCVVT